MTPFIRKFEFIKELKRDNLFNVKLLPDIKQGVVYPAVRRGYMSFYYAGGSLFRYDKGKFLTHYKYAFVPEESESTYITQDDIKNLKPRDFVNGYDQIKENCRLYAETEAGGVSKLFKFAQTNTQLHSEHRYYLVDIEVAFESHDKDKKTDRIDVLLYDNMEQKLLFCEAKHFSNSEIWAKAHNPPRVAKQLDRYKEQIRNRYQEIIEQYKRSFSIFNDCFDVRLNNPKNICVDCGLLIFGFDSQQKSKIKKLLLDDGSLNNYRHYEIGSMDNIEIATLFNMLSGADNA
jgi:hypothetical protein